MVESVSEVPFLSHAEESAHAVLVRHQANGVWAWEVIDPEGVTIADGVARTYSEAVSSAGAIEGARRRPSAKLALRLGSGG